MLHNALRYWELRYRKSRIQNHNLCRQILHLAPLFLSAFWLLGPMDLLLSPLHSSTRYQLSWLDTRWIKVPRVWDCRRETPYQRSRKLRDYNRRQSTKWPEVDETVFQIRGDESISRQLRHAKQLQRKKSWDHWKDWSDYLLLYPLDGESVMMKDFYLLTSFTNGDLI